MSGRHHREQPSRTPEVDRLLTVDELAEMIQIPKATLYKWRSEGTGPPGMRLGKYVRYRRSEVERWIDEQAAKEWE